MAVQLDLIDPQVPMTTAGSSAATLCTADPRGARLASMARGEEIPHPLAGDIADAGGDAITPLMVAGQRTAIRRSGVLDNSTQALHGWSRHDGTGHAATRRGGDDQK